ncbi:uncharacterized protein TRIADDRAFT_52263 [Trichoplax adhaerens]|uniref:Melanotransferrin n=1 Tax=Trichoplax adhaerens TaxID=10228 RepID=B3RM77_TRIAD|nr:hypothetical protein TRIADDRAFT_52263 [Trichoplax adhaerens]EDV28915.1 hypothetical protein TRIADDRAFT_52263 [Trichoplax adhaerens]|eukprot:XP_002108117.1 hypothetical protein TRIADDRAFT_52263 [Trichoplax adhaerens]
MTRLIFSLLLFTLTYQATHTFAAIRWCVISDLEMQKCQDMKASFRHNQVGTIDCVRGTSTSDCMSKIHSQLADIVTLDGGDVYIAGSQYNMVPIVAENYGLDFGASYYAVALVRNDSQLSLKDLKGTKSCHTGIGKTAGWNIPVSYLIEQQFMRPQNCNIPLSVGNYFSKSCAPGALSSKYNPYGNNPSNLCALCVGDASGNNKCARDSSERYYGYAGAFRCLQEAAGDVAFVKQSTVFDYDKQNSSYYRLLCKDGTKAMPADYKKCNLAKVPAHAVMVSAKTNKTMRQQLINMLMSAQNIFNQNATFQLFNSSKYQVSGRTGADLIFKDNTKRLDGLGTNSTYVTYLGAEYVAALATIHSCPKPLRICAVSSAENKKCLAMKAAVKKHPVLFPFIECVEGQSSLDCMQKINRNLADVIDLDTSDIFVGGEMYNLKPIMAENYGQGSGVTYYAVAVARKQSSTISLKNMRGAKSCHTGINKTAGWNIPVGLLLSKNIMPRKRSCDVAYNVGSFFEASCAPGALSAEYNPIGDNPSNLCSLCVGDSNGKNKCARNSNERYYNYAGAFRCLAEKAGDVAFIKHLTVNENTNGKNTASWASNLKSDDFELLCEDGSRKPVTQYTQCNLARVPSHAIVTSSLRSSTNQIAYKNLLQRMQGIFGTVGTDKSFKMFSSKDYTSTSGNAGKDLLFKDSTIQLEPLDSAATYKSYLGNNFLGALNATNYCKSSALMTAKISFGIPALLVVLNFLISSLMVRN